MAQVSAAIVKDFIRQKVSDNQKIDYVRLFLRDTNNIPDLKKVKDINSHFGDIPYYRIGSNLNVGGSGCMLYPKWYIYHIEPHNKADINRIKNNIEKSKQDKYFLVFIGEGNCVNAIHVLAECNKSSFLTLDKKNFYGICMDIDDDSLANGEIYLNNPLLLTIYELIKNFFKNMKEININQQDRHRIINSLFNELVTGEPNCKIIDKNANINQDKIKSLKIKDVYNISKDEVLNIVTLINAKINEKKLDERWLNSLEPSGKSREEKFSNVKTMSLSDDSIKMIIDWHKDHIDGVKYVKALVHADADDPYFYAFVNNFCKNSLKSDDVKKNIYFLSYNAYYQIPNRVQDYNFIQATGSGFSRRDNEDSFDLHYD